MKRLLKIVAILVALIVLGVGTLLAATFMGRASVVDGQDFNGIRVVADGFSSLGFVPVGGREVVLIDAGNDADATAIITELARRGLGPDSVSAIFLTHGHQDHTGGVLKFPKAQVMALEAEVPIVEGSAGSNGPLTRLFPVRPTGIKVARALQDGDAVTIGDSVIRVYAVAGHTAGSAAYLVNGVLFVGDSADVASDGSLMGAPWVFSDDQAQNRASLVSLEQRLAADGGTVMAIVPAHSGSVRGIDALSAFARAEQTP
jgi:glyoxylase-like metal-dependent hydrolase (beta-lactamase superfamily II)